MPQWADIVWLWCRMGGGKGTKLTTLRLTDFVLICRVTTVVLDMHAKRECIRSFVFSPYLVVESAVSHWWKWCTEEMHERKSEQYEVWALLEKSPVAHLLKNFQPSCGCKLKVQYCVLKSPPLGPIYGQIDPATSSLPMIHFNIVLPMSRSS
jgi:hypothetical protein